MKYRRELDIRRFAQAAGEQSNLIQLITAMQEIKLNNCEKQKRWQWERIQVKLFKISIKGLAVGQVQQVGSIFFNQTTNIVISFIAAKSVVEGEMTLGMMMSLTYIIGQLSGPIGAFIGFAQSFHRNCTKVASAWWLFFNLFIYEQKPDTSSFLIQLPLIGVY